MDITYKPLITPLIDAAQKMGVVTVTGERMFINQAFEQFKLWTGKNAPEPEMQKAMLNNWV
ncbi:hypothetical protein HYW82_01440 [Candidatus Peregrinibacteria bacterium]|nr:hypothetical protein [Candidatus Peregrinibacteria bacterium]